uniref:Uncharacterized protein n=1 Tax=Electrophorus electricus TaxID=8005 RepID=A0A4W4F0Z0_ELEEL
LSIQLESFLIHKNVLREAKERIGRVGERAWLFSFSCLLYSNQPVIWALRQIVIFTFILLKVW